jgi:hypothetical protein
MNFKGILNNLAYNFSVIAFIFVVIINFTFLILIINQKCREKFKYLLFYFIEDLELE